MHCGHRESGRTSRRLVVVALVLAGCLLGFASTASAATQNPIQAENSLPGTSGWDAFASVAQQDAISGFASKTSVNHGDSIDFYVTTTAPSVTIDIFRTGWYQGIGARLVQSLGTFPGVHQAIPAPDPVTGMVSCDHWTKTTTLNVPSTWVTGVYLAKLTASTGNQSFIVFTVRDDGGTEPILFQSSVTTYQAYNAWGGTSLYTNNTNGSVYPYGHATKVSFDRPYDPLDGNGTGHFFAYEYPFIRWAESQGYNISYITDVDTATNVNPLTNHRVFLSVGHDEYWSHSMRDNVTNAISQGVNAAFFSANTAYWQIRFEADSLGVANRVEVGYKDYATFDGKPGPDPQWNFNNSVVTTNWRADPVNLPENSFIGVMYQDQVNQDYAYVVQNASNWIYAGTGFTNGTSIPGIVGYEYDKVWNNGFSPPGEVVLSNSPVVGCCEGSGNSFSNSTLYTAPSGAQVFAGGTIQWSWGLDNYSSDGQYVNAGIQKTTANILNAFSAGSSSAPAVSLSPSSLSFAGQAVGSSSAAQSVTLTNSGTAALSISGIAITGANAADFGQSNTCPASLAVNASCSISVTFSPSAGGARAATVSITDNVPGSPQTIALSGTGATSAVSLSPSSVSFGSVALGARSAAKSLTLTNSGTAPLAVSGVAVTGANAGDFAETNNCPVPPATLAVSATCTLSVTFSPTASGSRAATVQITDNAADSPQSAPLSGTGVGLAPAVSLAPASLSFGSQQVGSTSSAQSITLTNSGNAALAISSIAVSGSNAGDFAQTNTCPASLAAGASCSIAVTFAPTATGARTASVQVTDNAGDSPESVSLSGSGSTPAASLSPSSVSFGSVLLGNTSPAQSVTLTNSGSAPLSISGIAVTGANAGDFAETDNCPVPPATLGASATCTLSLTFSPTASGSRAAAVQITDNAADSPQRVQLGGTGLAPAPAVGLSPSSLAFGSQLTGTTSAAKSVTLTNPGSAPLAISGIAVMGTNAGDFAETDNCPSTLPVSGTCTLSVTFSPAASGSRAASVQITDGAGDSPQSVTLGGTGADPAPAVSLAPASVTFGSQLVGNSSTAQSVTVTNSGTAALSIGGIGLAGTNGSDFGQTNSCPTTLAVNASCTISVTFNPSATGSRTGSVQITDNAANSPQSVGLSGTGVAPAVGLSPATLSFGSQLIGTPSSSHAVTLTNTGTGALSISSIALAGANAGDFAQTNTCPASVAVNASCTISVTFNPSAAGSRTASVQVTDNAPNSPQSIGLSGTGSTSSVSLDQNLGTYTENRTGATMKMTTTKAAAAGTRVFAFVNWSGGSSTLSSVSGGGLTWTVDGQVKGALSDYRVGIASAYAPAGLPSGTALTATFSAGATHGDMAAASFRGIASSAPVDVVAKSTQNGVTNWSASITTVNANDLVLGASIFDGQVTNTPTAPNLLIQSFNNVPFYSALTSEYQIATTAGTKTVSGTWSGNTTGSITNATVVVAYKAG